jgi:DNA-binding beta-propeller fold protein YncE
MKILGQAGGNLAESPESGFAAIVNRARQLAMPSSRVRAPFPFCAQVESCFRRPGSTSFGFPPMIHIHPRIAIAAMAVAAGCPASAQNAGRILPGPQQDGSVLLHNQWSIRPAGDQIPLGEFPVNLVLDPSGRYAAILHSGYGQHEVRVIDLADRRTTDVRPVTESFQGLAFSPDGRMLVCGGGSEPLLHVFSFAAGALSPLPDVQAGAKEDRGVNAGVIFVPASHDIVVARLFENQVLRIDCSTGNQRWAASLGQALGDNPSAPAREAPGARAPNDVLGGREVIGGGDPFELAWDQARNRVYVSLWGESCVAVLDGQSGRVDARWPCGLHPNALLLLPRRGLFSGHARLLVSNGGMNSVTILDAETGAIEETLSSAMSPGDLPGSTPDSLALSPDGRTLYVANAYNNNVAVFDIGVRGAARPLGFIPTGWFPTSVRVTPDGRNLLVVSARGLTPKSDSAGSAKNWPRIEELFRGSLGIVALPRDSEFDRALAAWTGVAQRCRPAPPAGNGGQAGGPIPSASGGASPIRYVIYVIKENRTYDQVFGDLPQGNGDPALCLFPEETTPNHHALARQFVLLDNFYANAEVSAGGHEWSTAAYSSEFVERSWPVYYGHRPGNASAKGSRPPYENVPYPSEGHFAAALPQLGYLWDQAAKAGISYRSYGEFVANGKTAAEPASATLPALKGHIDPLYRGFDTDYSDQARANQFLAELRKFDAAGDMPRLQIVRLPSDHTNGARAGHWTPQAMVADNDLALGRVIDAVSHSRFWPQTAVFIVEDDAQNGPDHVDAHRTVALVASPYCRPGSVDSTPYTTCSMLRTIELILGLEPMSQFDAAAAPMRACFRAQADASVFTARPARVDLDRRNPARTKLARISEGFDLSREDAIDEQTFNHVIWAAVRGEGEPMPAPVHAAFVRALPRGDGDGD